MDFRRISIAWQVSVTVLLHKLRERPEPVTADKPARAMAVDTRAKRRQ